MRAFLSHCTRVTACVSALTLGSLTHAVEPPNVLKAVAPAAGKAPASVAAPSFSVALLALDRNLPLLSGELGHVTLAELLLALTERSPAEAHLPVLRDVKHVSEWVSSIYGNRWLSAKGQSLKGKVQEPEGAAPSELARHRFWAEEYMRHEVLASMPKPDVITKLAVSARTANPHLYAMPADKKVRHILLAARQDDAQVEAKAQALLAKIQSGADFAALAKKESQDAGSAANGGDLGWVMNQEYAPAFKAQVEKLNAVGQQTEVFRTDFGYHIVQLDEINPERPMTDAEASILMQEQVFQRRNTEVRQRLWAQAREGVQINEANVAAVVKAAMTP